MNAYDFHACFIAAPCSRGLFLLESAKYQRTLFADVRERALAGRTDASRLRSNRD